MARVLVLTRDLLFGSRVQAMLAGAGHQVELAGDESRLQELLEGPIPAAPAVLLVDLTDAELGGAAIVQSLADDGLLATTRTLAFYSHVDAATRKLAGRTGFDLVVPRSRMAREGAELVARLLHG
jgi:CheY-like chemotaxis protein